MRHEYKKPGWKATLRDELTAAGITVHYMGGTPGDPDGVVVETDADEPAVAAVVNAHDPAALDTAAQQEAQARQTWRDNLQAYIDAPTPTNAQTVAVVKILCRGVLRLWRLLG